MLNCYFKKCVFAVSILLFVLLQKTFAFTVPHWLGGHMQQTSTDTVTGVVFDSFTRGIAGVKVSVIKNPGLTTHTDNNGNFSIIASKGHLLLFEHPSFNIHQQRVRTGINRVRLTETYLKNPDTVDVLYGSIAKDNNLGAISSIYTNQITSTPATIFPYALPGRLSGLYTSQYSGYRSVNTTNSISAAFLYNTATSFGNGPGSDNNEMGLSLRGQSPITIIDGVQREFSSLDFESIESITVLKDALSTILLGQFSSNGVLLVTTKKPTAGAPRISATAQTGVQESLKMPTPLSAYEYAYLYNEALQNGGASPVYSIDDFNAYRNGTNGISHPDINWYKTLTRKYAPMTKYNVNLNGGSSAARYVVSLGYLHQQTMFKDYNLESYNTSPELKRYTINSNIDVNLGKSFNVAMQLFGRIQDGNQPGATTSALLSGMYNTPNNAYPIYNSNGTFGGGPDFSNNLFSQLTRSGYMLDYARDVMVNLDMTYRFDNYVKGLWVKLKGNLTTGSTNIVNRSKSSAVYQQLLTADGDTLYNRYGNQSDQSNSYSLTSSNQFWYAQLSTGIDRQFDLHNVSVMLFADQRQAYVNFDLPAKSTNIAAKTSYNYNNKYFAEATVNYAGYDRYEPGIRFGWFYAGGLGWKISEERFIKDNVSWINLLKLRATYGKTGNANIGYYSYRASFEEGDSYTFGSASPSGFPALREKQTLTTVGATWEKANKFNVGIDLNILNNKFSFTADYYNNRYYDLMRQRGNNTSIIGASYPNENIGINRFSGTEFSVTYRNNIRDFNYFVTANTSIEYSKVIFQDEIARKYDFNRRTGQPVGMQFGYEVTGIIQTEEEAAASPTFDGYVMQPGDLKYVDQNGDGKITSDYDIIAIGNGKPRVYYGATLGFSYKGFDFSVLIQGVANRQLNISYGIENNRQTFQQILERWTPASAATATLPRVTVGYNPANTPTFGTSNSFYMRPGSYLRIKNVDIGYNLPFNIVRKLGITGLRVFANGLNLLTFSKYDVIDPEVYGTSYPIQRVFNTGVNIRL